MDKEINVMMERKVWDLVDHPDNIKILENRWVYTIKYDENNKIVRYKARLVARASLDIGVICAKFMRRKRVILPMKMIPQRKKETKENLWSNGIPGASEAKNDEKGFYSR
ncbi:hypothetical protein TNCV_4223581 [Trichonephila clavipes]|nr:hypothetical protein TNCV_4223581 [Trichonephila clavipes]